MMKRRRTHFKQEDGGDGDDEEVVVLETFREAVPTHYLFKIQSFSLLSRNSIEKYESNEFEAGGYKWKLSLYPEGNKNEEGKSHISLYLMMVDTTSLPAGWELKVVFRLFLFDQLRDRYMTREGGTSRFHGMKTVWGFSKFVSLAKFNDPSNGYLMDDNCVFGAEVFVYKSIGNGECLSMVKHATTVHYAWKIEDISKIEEETIYSEKFRAGGHYWKFLIYPNGFATGKNNSLSLFLKYVDCENDAPGLKVYANLKLRIRDQITDKHIESKAKHWFHASSKNWGWWKFIGLDVLNDQGNGFLVKDSCVVEAEIKVPARDMPTQPKKMKMSPSKMASKLPEEEAL